MLAKLHFFLNWKINHDIKTVILNAINPINSSVMTLIDFSFFVNNFSLKIYDASFYNWAMALKLCCTHTNEFPDNKLTPIQYFRLVLVSRSSNRFRYRFQQNLSKHFGIGFNKIWASILVSISVLASISVSVLVLVKF